MKVLEQAVRMSRDGFTELELDKLDQFRRIQVNVDVAGEADKLSTPNVEAPAPPSRPRSGLDSF